MSLTQTIAGYRDLAVARKTKAKKRSHREQLAIYAALLERGHTPHSFAAQLRISPALFLRWISERADVRGKSAKLKQKPE